jgi:hypothetical protein
MNLSTYVKLTCADKLDPTVQPRIKYIFESRSVLTQALSMMRMGLHILLHTIFCSSLASASIHHLKLHFKPLGQL